MSECTHGYVRYPLAHARTVHVRQQDLTGVMVVVVATGSAVVGLCTHSMLRRRFRFSVEANMVCFE